MKITFLVGTLLAFCAENVRFLSGWPPAGNRPPSLRLTRPACASEPALTTACVWARAARGPSNGRMAAVGVRPSCTGARTPVHCTIQSPSTWHAHFTVGDATRLKRQSSPFLHSATLHHIRVDYPVAPSAASPSPPKRRKAAAASSDRRSSESPLSPAPASISPARVAMLACRTPDKDMPCHQTKRPISTSRRASGATQASAGSRTRSRHMNKVTCPANA